MGRLKTDTADVGAPAPQRSRYTLVAMGLHWAIAIAVLAMLATGFWMVDAIKIPATQATAFHTYQFHKSLGLTILLLTLARLGWRLWHPPPPLPMKTGPWSRRVAHSAHGLFYVLMIAMPLTGWAMVSASPLGLPTIVFGWFEWPHIIWLETAADKATLEAQLKQLHATAGLIMVGLIVLHVAAALKHQFVDRDGLIARMVPFGAATTSRQGSP